MNIYLISQSINRGYDTYDSAVVAARDADEARDINPNPSGWDDAYSTWCPYPHQVTITFLGEAKPNTVPGILLASFNAG